MHHKIAASIAAVGLALVALLGFGTPASAETRDIVGGGCANAYGDVFRGDVQRYIHADGTVDFGYEDTWANTAGYATAWVSWDGNANHSGYPPEAEGWHGEWAYPETESGPGGPYLFTYLDNAYVKWTFHSYASGHTCSLWITAGGAVSEQDGP